MSFWQHILWNGKAEELVVPQILAKVGNLACAMSPSKQISCCWCCFQRSWQDDVRKCFRLVDLLLYHRAPYLAHDVIVSLYLQAVGQSLLLILSWLASIWMSSCCANLLPATSGRHSLLCYLAVPSAKNKYTRVSAFCMCQGSSWRFHLTYPCLAPWIAAHNCRGGGWLGKYSAKQHKWSNRLLDGMHFVSHLREIAHHDVDLHMLLCRTSKLCAESESTRPYDYKSHIEYGFDQDLSFIFCPCMASENSCCLRRRIQTWVLKLNSLVECSPRWRWICNQSKLHSSCRLSRAEQSRAEQSRAEQSRAEQSRA